jgi:hypothetical protein
MVLAINHLVGATALEWEIHERDERRRKCSIIADNAHRGLHQAALQLYVDRVYRGLDPRWSFHVSDDGHAFYQQTMPLDCFHVFSIAMTAYKDAESKWVSVCCRQDVCHAWDVDKTDAFLNGLSAYAEAIFAHNLLKFGPGVCFEAPVLQIGRSFDSPGIYSDLW